MSTSLPIVRDTRQRELSAAAGQTVFTFDAPLIDTADLAVFSRAASSSAWTEVTAGITKALLPDGAGCTVTFTVAPRLTPGDEAVTIRLKSVRVHERTTDVTRGGAIRGSALEAELDRQSMVLQELRRDVDDAEAIDIASEVVLSARDEAIAARDTAATYAASTAAKIFAGLIFAEIAAVAVPAPVVTLETVGYATAGDGGKGLYRRTAAAPYDVMSSDGALWIYADDTVRGAAFGVVSGSRAAAAANDAAIAAALAAADRLNVELVWPPGSIFYGAGGGVVQAFPLSHRGAGAVGEWSKVASSTQGLAETTFVAVGSPARTDKVGGISSMVAWGGGRVNASHRSATHNDTVYKHNSWITPSASASGRTRRGFSTAWHMTPAASGSRMIDVRFVPDYGGDDGLDGYRDAAAWGDVAYPLTDGDWDVGLWLDNVRECYFERVQFVGQWRMTGRFGHACAKNNPAALYKNTFVDCTWSGYHGTDLRGFDAAPVVAKTTTSIDMPWADDHPFGADGDMELALSNGSWPGTTKYTFTTMTKVTGGPYDVLRLSGITPDVPTTTTNAFPYYQGGGTSHWYDIGGEIQSFQHPSKLPCHIKGLAGVAGGVFDSPGGCLFVSGTKVTEVQQSMTSLTTYDEISAFIHDCRGWSFDGYVEMNGDRGRLVLSGPPSLNTHSLAGFAHGGARDVRWIHRGSTINNGSLDTRPALPHIEATPFTSDNGLAEPYYFYAPMDPGMVASLDEGAVLIAPPGGVAGLGRRSTSPDFYNPTPADLDLALYYDEAGDLTRVRKLIRSNTAGQASIGAFGAGAFFEGICQIFGSYKVTVADDAVANIAAPAKGMVYLVVEGSTSDLPNIALYGLGAIDVGTSPGASKWAGGANFAALSGTANLTGTTGTDGNVSIGAGVGIVQIENRAAASKTFTIVFFGG